MAKINHIENFIHWLTHEGKLVEILGSGSDQIPVVAESMDEHNWPFYKYAFIRKDQDPSQGVIKGKAIPPDVLRNGKIKKEGKAEVADFVEGFGVTKEVAARVSPSWRIQSLTIPARGSIRDGTPIDCCVTFDTNLHGDRIMWIRETVQTEPDDLVLVEWKEIEDHLPELQKLKKELEGRTLGHLTYNRQTHEWDG